MTLVDTTLAVDDILQATDALEVDDIYRKEYEEVTSMKIFLKLGGSWNLS